MAHIPCSYQRGVFSNHVVPACLHRGWGSDGGGRIRRGSDHTVGRTQCRAAAVGLLPFSALTQVSHTVMVTSREDLGQCSRPRMWMMEGLGKTAAAQVKRKVRASKPDGSLFPRVLRWSAPHALMLVRLEDGGLQLGLCRNCGIQPLLASVIESPVRHLHRGRQA